MEAEAVCEALCRWLHAVGDESRAEERQALFEQVQLRLREWWEHREDPRPDPLRGLAPDWVPAPGAAWPVGDN